ncbi:MAG: pirin family protein [Saprospiraceae bacterium]
MDRKTFIKRSALGLGALATGPSVLKASNVRLKKSTYDQLAEQVGFNHLPIASDIKTIPGSTMKMIHHPADTRGHADHGWLDSHHSFSFANYYNPERMHFGVLRVLNDDIVAPGRGFGTHPHDNMEIISIPLSGDLEHKDSMGNVAVIREGDIQLMSAGTGVYHSEYNRNPDQEVRFLQIWLFPREKQVTPRYDQLPIRNVAQPNSFYQVLSPSARTTRVSGSIRTPGSTWANSGRPIRHIPIRRKGNGVYAFMIEGSGEISGQPLQRRDGLGVWDTDELTFTATTNSRILLMDIPMVLS